MILDIYFKRPVLWDYTIALFTSGILFILFRQSKIALPEVPDSYSLTGDLTNIALTLGGFILTILTLIITFKDNSSASLNDPEKPVFNKFFATPYYYETVKHLKNCIKSISIIAALGFLLKLFIPLIYRNHLFFFNFFGLIIVMLTVYRCLLILGKILDFQKQG